MSALDDVRRALTEAYGTDVIFDGLTVEDLLKAVTVDEQHAVAAELRDAAADIGRRLHAGGPKARGLAFARLLLVSRANGTPLEAPASSTSHVQAARACRAQPGVWLPVGDYSTKQSANSIAWQIRSGGGRISAYTSAGEFESRIEPTPLGTRVLARYVGTDRKDDSL